MKTNRPILARKSIGRYILILIPLLFIGYLFARSNTYDQSKQLKIVTSNGSQSTQQQDSSFTSQQQDIPSEDAINQSSSTEETETLTSQLLMKAGIDPSLTPTTNRDEWMGGAVLPQREPPPSAIPRPFNKQQDDDLESALTDLSRCTNMRCIIHAHDKIDGRTRFNLPHFFLIGWQKTAINQVNAYLSKHPQYQPSIANKEPHWFTKCQPDQDFSGCQANNETQYFRDFLAVREAASAKLELATADTSADYAREGAPLARRLYRYFPWLKIVVMMKEPISRLISVAQIHTNTSSYDGTGCSPWSTLLYCLMPHLTPGNINSNYSEPLEGWLTTFPANQIHVIQYEELQHTPEKVLYDLKVFLGLNPDEPKQDFEDKTFEKESPLSIRKGQYQRLVRMVREDAEQVAGLLDRYGLADRAGWMSRWEQVWQDSLKTCDADDMCYVKGTVVDS